MRHMRRGLIGCLVMILVCIFVPSISVKAAGTTVISVSQSSIKVGDKLTVTVQPSQTTTIHFKYNSDVLKLTGCDASGYTTEGRVITYTGGTAKFTFEAIGAGSSGLIVTPESQEVEGSSTTVQVTGGETAASQTPTQPQTTTPAQPQFEIDGTGYVVSERYSSKEIPAGFSKTDMTIQGKTYKELSNGKLALVYLKPASNTSGSGTFFIYNEQTQSVEPMTLIGSLQDYVILLTTEEVPGRLSPAALTVGEQQVSGYQIAENADDFYYLYGMDETGTQQWFEYDAKDGSIQRANTALLEQAEAEIQEPTQTTDASDAGKTGVSTLRLVIAGLIFVLVVLVIVVINLLLGRRRDREEFDFEDSEEEFDADGDADAAYDPEDEFYEKDTPRIREMFSDQVQMTEDFEPEDDEEALETSEAEEAEPEIGDAAEAAEPEIDDAAEETEPETDDGSEEFGPETDDEPEESEPETDAAAEEPYQEPKKEKEHGEKELDFNDLEILDLNDL